ncbi:UDP-N-acetylglucosamine-dolichyl-phosphate N-acetylglucosaminephosphotransferase [Giardia duodenalis]|uniref:UDP-N-acetylglucosamine--dolichyl-phosphate N-acetylglucosaminephosphotransferase n=1 Tax=Giardia intestinalis (strain ATCC 50803 / WB clone C6) TaxID=184922 RepID=A8BTW2_GIAIC|nr:UDP-N-acetylglucosamine-dolichyl-phosphate N-acetylglucosaminephosphotransferase [Giardia intestinalis]KAE8301263.1 UDP-N-acetylglucosamine-dolichyl-phosphate N-acetylglucosaminephosphotransferase [Giardia intestinalis]|eukprot:XP_001704857.1 UDP-N-acetylglucosamine-dolichyl-phosphate N-acetylglucosaminephosphotransferase [Giardia lamblia ATCC 50803]
MTFLALFLLIGLASIFCGSVLSSLTLRLILELAPKLEKAGLSGRDLNKAVSEKIPEDAGLGPSAMFLLTISLWSLVMPRSSTLLSAGFSIMASSFLGFVDDVVNLRWRYKLIVPSITLLPLVGAYSGSGLSLGPLRLTSSMTKLYCLLFAIFSQNAVNIYAGINGLEVGQSIVACTFLLPIVLYKLYVALDTTRYAEHLAPWQRLLSHPSLLSSLVIIVCFLAVSHPVYLLNRYPSRVFVGDIYAYFAGSVFASACILSDTLIAGPLLFLPQILNFVLSVPQLFGIVPCPRHRLPRFSQDHGTLTGVATHLNLINQYLRIRGPLSEKRLCRELLSIQAIISAFVVLFFVLARGKVENSFVGVHRKL